MHVFQKTAQFIKSVASLKFGKGQNAWF